MIVEKTWWETNSANPYWATAPLAQAQTDASGRAELDHIPAESIRISVAAKGYVSRLLNEGGAPTLPKYSVLLAKSATIRGTVLDADGHPVASANVRPMTLMGLDGLGYQTGLNYGPLDKVEADTDAAGSFELSGLPTGYAQIYAMAPGYCFSDMTIYDVPSTNMVLRMERAGEIKVSISDKDGKPVSRFDGNPLLVNAQALGESNNSGSDAIVENDGTCDFQNVPPGKYRVTSRPNPSYKSGQYAPEQIVFVRGGAIADVRITLKEPSN